MRWGDNSGRGQKAGDMREKKKERVEVAPVDCVLGKTGAWGGSGEFHREQGTCSGAALVPAWGLRAEKRSVDVF